MTFTFQNKIPKKHDRSKRQAIMAAPVPHFMAAPAVHPPILAGFAPAVTSSPLAAAAPVAMTSPFVQPVAIPALNPQIVPISAAGQPLSKFKLKDFVSCHVRQVTWPNITTCFNVFK